MDIAKVIAELTRDESLKLKPYRCPAGKLTIGVGRNLEANGISLGEAEIMLRNDIEGVAIGLDKEIPWWRNLSEVRQRVLVNMAFNLGVDGLLPGGKNPGFPNTIKLIEAGQYLEAAQAMLASKWAKQVGPRAIRLAAMMRDG